MITKFLRKLLGRTDSADTPPAPTGDTLPAAATGQPGDAAGPVKKRAPRKKPRAPAGVLGTSSTPPTAPTIVPVDVHGIDLALISRNAIRVTDTLQQAGFSAFIVGGAVRDLLLGISPKDFDVATNATPEQAQGLFRRARVIGRRFQIVHAQFGQEIIEVSTFRALMDGSANAAGETGSDADATRTTVTSAAAAGAAGSASATATATAAANAASSPPGGSAGRRRRAELDRHPHAIDASGRVLRDNVWGEQHEDATRRDFTINAMYYDPSTQTVLDYHNGMADMRARTLRMIGEPTARFREDPVRMLRVVRFAAKLGFTIDPATRAPLAELSSLIDNVPAARLFDEVLKLLLSGHSLACLQQLRAEGLHRTLLPALDAALSSPHSEKFIALALTSTDARVRAGKTVLPGFLFAALLWREVQETWQKQLLLDDAPIPALHAAMDEVLVVQTRALAIQRRYSGDMKEIWSLQPRMEKRSARSAAKLIEHQKFRAAYDFLLLRCESGELDAAVGQWWIDFTEGNVEARAALLAETVATPRAPRRSRRRGARGGAAASGNHAASSADSGRSRADSGTEEPEGSRPYNPRNDQES